MYTLYSAVGMVLVTTAREEDFVRTSLSAATFVVFAVYTANVLFAVVVVLHSFSSFISPLFAFLACCSLRYTCFPQDKVEKSP